MNNERKETAKYEIIAVPVLYLRIHTAETTDDTNSKTILIGR